jgi:hypothetical protein
MRLLGGNRGTVGESVAFERALERDRANDVRPQLYQGRRDAGFDEWALFCFAIEHAEREFTVGVDDVVDVLEREVGALPVGIRARARERFDQSGVSKGPRGDDLRRVAAVDMVVDEVASYWVTRVDTPR